MQEYTHLRQQKSMLIPVVALALCVVLSACMLFSRLVGFVTEDASLMIPLTESNGVTKVASFQRVQTQAPSAALLSNRSNAVVVPLDNEEKVKPTDPAKPGFQVEDKNTVWEGKTDVEIFRVSYENGEGQITVQSGKGDKVIAPGTENAYSFTLHNTGNVPLDYVLEMEAYFSDGEKVIPVKARVVDYNGKYLVGSADGFADVLELNTVREQGSLSAGYIAPYTLQWQWPFEGDDDYDTWLGNLAAEEDITLTIVIRTTAEFGGEGGKPPQTGDQEILVAAVVMVGSFAGLLVVLLLPKRKREATHVG